MSSIDFVDLVSKMRAAQNAYYANRTHSNLIAAKELESAVDKALKEQLKFKVSEDRQPELMETTPNISGEAIPGVVENIEELWSDNDEE